MAEATRKPKIDLQPRPGGTHAVLVASGDGDIRRLLCDTFQNDSYLVHEEATEDGAVALALISRPALVVIDSELSAGNGVRACLRLKEHRLTRDCKVVVISGHATLEEQARAEAAGADTFRAKPFSPLELIEIARAVCGGPPRAERTATASGM